MPKGHQPRPAVILRQGVEGAQRHPRRAHQPQMRPPGPGDHHHHGGDDQYAARGGKVWLHQDQQEHDPRQQEQRREAPEEPGHIPPLLTEGTGEVDDHRVLRQLRGLEADRSQPQPAPGAVQHPADARHRHQRQHRQAERQQSAAQPGPGQYSVIDPQKHEHRRRAHAHAEQLGEDLGQRAAAVLRVVVAGGVQRRQARHQQQRRGERESPVHAREHALHRISLRGGLPRVIGPGFGPQDQACRPSRRFTMSLNTRPRSS